MKIYSFETVAEFHNRTGESLRIRPEDHIKVITDNTEYPKIITGVVESIDENGTIVFGIIDDSSVEKAMPNPYIELEYIKEIKIIE